MSTSTVAASPARGHGPDWRDDAACRDADPEPKTNDTDCTIAAVTFGRPQAH